MAILKDLLSQTELTFPRLDFGAHGVHSPPCPSTEATPDSFQGTTDEHQKGESNNGTGGKGIPSLFGTARTERGYRCLASHSRVSRFPSEICAGDK